LKGAPKGRRGVFQQAGPSPTASLTALQSPDPVTLLLPELRGYAAKSLASATTRSAGRPSPICRTPPASLARMIRSSLPTKSLPGPRGGRGRCAYLASLGRQQRIHQRPLLVGEGCLLRRDRDRLGRSFCAGRGPRGAFGGQARLAAAGRHRLVRPPPGRPPQMEASSAFRRGHGEDELPRLRHCRRDEIGVEPPFLGLPSSSTAALWRVRARKPWASKLRVMWRCHESHLLTS
jgi:hypothetical protein